MTLLKNTIKVSIQGIGIACTLYLINGMIFDYLNHGSFICENWLFSRQAIGTILVGIAFSAPTVIYGSERFPFILQFLFHMGIGCTVYVIVGLSVGWFSMQLGWRKCILLILLQLAVAFLIWLGYAFHYRKLAKNMNKKIQEKEKES